MTDGCTDIEGRVTDRKRAHGLTAADCVAALRDRYPERSHALLEQVANGTGFKANRWADVVTMSLWPSRGLYFSGFEIKVSKSDFTREMADPAKAEEIQGFCTEWWIVAPQGLLEAHEMPPTWGLLEVTDKLKCRVVKPAPTLDARPVSMSFVAALLRRSSECTAGLLKREFRRGQEDGAANGQGEMARRLTLATENAQAAWKLIDDFKVASGVDIRRAWRLGDVGEAVRVLSQSGHNFRVREMRTAAENFRIWAKRADEDAATLEELLERRKVEAAE